jgi:hypothetical protein
MTIQVQTSLMSGGLDLVTPPIAMPPGKAISAINYEPDVAGYSSTMGFERFDGHASPSSSTNPTEVAHLRTLINEIPGTGPVRGVVVFEGALYAFRDVDATTGGMYKSTVGGWSLQTFGHQMAFSTGSAEFLEGELIVGGTSLATATVERIILRSGAWDGTAEGYFVLSNITGTFVGETVTGVATSSTAVVLAPTPLSIRAGGRYDFTINNFYGSARFPYLYFANAVGNAWEWSGSVLAPIHTGTASGTVGVYDYLIAYNGDFILAADGSSIILGASFDAPEFVEHYKSHLFVGYSSGSLINSSLGSPLEYVTTTGAGETSFGDRITGMLTSSTALVVTGQNRISYMTGDDASSWVLSPVSQTSGAQPYSLQMMDEPVFLDDAGVRKLTATSAFGDWSTGTLTQPVEPLVLQKRNTNVVPVASLKVKARDQYKLFWDDGTGLTVYLGRKRPETLPFNLPIDVYCATAGEIENGQGDRLFVGSATDGFVYELNRGTSFDGANIKTFIRLPFSAAGSPAQETRWTKVTFELATPDTLDVGVAFDVDYARGIGTTFQINVDLDAGSAIVTTDHYEDIDWTQAVQGRLEFHLAGIGPNIATTLITETADARQHTLSSQTYNFSRRRLKR